MIGWETVAVRDVADVFDGPHATPAKTEEGPWYLSISSLSNGRFDFAQSAHLSDADLPRWTRRVAPRPGDTLFSYETRLGEAAYWGHDVPAALGRRMGLLRPKPGKVEPRYLAYAYLGPQFQDVIREKTLHGATVNRIPVGEMPSWPLLLPPIDDQRAILGVLDAIDGLIENNRRRVQLLEEIARAIYREWFVKFRYPGHEAASLVASPLGPIPAGWSAGRLGDLADEIRESAKPGDFTRSVPYVPIDEIDARSLTLHRSRPGEDAASSLRVFREGDVLFGAMRAYFHKVCLAPFEGVTRSTCFVLRPRADWGVLPLLYLDDDETVAYASNHSSGSTIPYAKWDGVLSERKVAIPPVSLAKAFSKIAQPMLLHSRSLSRQSGELAATRDLVLPKLVTGQTNVSALNLDGLLEEAVA
ncbi:restriction endonuclease subunit S [Agromyces sp. S2-1-8]|uniref:restriction endonuclease subunit S n=1 Tax=Agromyces sp. S2-1-8 TaxID=2897180 RepID=UPI001E3942AC|nr:restriction endonuclease subunit S [Agromyces sp. S2-1-8]MCD5346127.1 restriction endonuclease subunit S [Agromyces sp. S2-1-8]